MRIRSLVAGLALAAAGAAVVAPAVPAGASSAPSRTIADIVAASGGTFDNRSWDYDILLNAAKAADPAVLAALSGPGPLTVFAPNDAGFIRTARDLGYKGWSEQGAFTFLAGALSKLGPLDQVLKTVIFYHAVPGKLGPIQVILQGSKPAGLTTVQGGTINVSFLTLIDKDPQLRNPNLTLPINVQASNGVVHSIDRVLIPLDL